jgi:hypothetical protein
MQILLSQSTYGAKTFFHAKNLFEQKALSFCGAFKSSFYDAEGLRPGHIKVSQQSRIFVQLTNYLLSK